ncbi:MAG: cupin domain-containing protein [Candidatus Omnitrophota bacterium]
MDIISVKNPMQEELKSLNIDAWPIWEKEISRFNWKYDETETCYILEGKARVEPEQGDAVEFEKGDLVTFPKGLKCVWDITSPIKKHYKFG